MVNDGEVVGSSRQFTQYKGRTRVIGSARVLIEVGDIQVVADQAQLFGPGGQFLAWSWYRVGNDYTSNDYMAKFREALGALGFEPAGASRIVLVVRLEDSVDTARAVMRAFLHEHGGMLDKALSPVLAEKH